METRRKEVGRQIKIARRLKKFRSQKAFADHIDIHEGSVANAEIGSDRIGEAVFMAIEDGLDWPIGSIEAYLNGTGERPWELAAEPVRPEPVEQPPRHEWSADARRKILAMSMDDMLDFGRQIGETSGERAAILWLKEATRLKAEAPSVEDSPL